MFLRMRCFLFLRKPFLWSNKRVSLLLLAEIIFSARFSSKTIVEQIEETTTERFKLTTFRSRTQIYVDKQRGKSFNYILKSLIFDIFVYCRQLSSLLYFHYYAFP